MRSNAPTSFNPDTVDQTDDGNTLGRWHFDEGTGTSVADDDAGGPMPMTTARGQARGTSMNSEDVKSAFEFVSSDYSGEHQAFLDKETGDIYWHSEFGVDEEDLPEDIDTDRYLAIPHKRDFGLGKPLALRFADLHLPDRYGKVRDIFSRPGAYARFKDLVEHEGKLKEWYLFENTECQAALRDWCRDHGINVEG